MTLPRLPVFEQLDYQKLIPPFFNFGNHGQVERHKVLYQTGCILGIQQHTNQKGDEWKVAFKTNKGLFELTVMFFGMCNSPATFQAMMDNIFVTMIKGKLVIVYMDDIPFAHCSMDLITDLPLVKGYDSILVVGDRGLSKGVILCPCAKTLTWKGTAILL